MLYNQFQPDEDRGAESFSNNQVDTANLPKAEQSEFIPLQKSYLYMVWVGNGISALILFVGTVVGIAFGGLWFKLDVLLLIILGYLIIVTLIFTTSYLGFRIKGYAIREHDIIYKTGWLWRKWIAIPFNRVQHCEIKKGPLEELFELSSLRVFTAGGSGSDLTIPGIPGETAASLKAYILKKTAVDEEE